MLTSAEIAAVSPDRSGVSWAAIFAGAAGAAALSLILLVLGAGLGFAVVSPWAGEGASAKGLGMGGIAWLALTQIIASALGGYLAGRLRGRWSRLHGDEVHFRDTAHGFLAWSIATLVTAALLLGTAGSLLGRTVEAGSHVAAAASAGVMARGERDPQGYFIDMLFRDDRPAAVSDDAAHGVATRIVLRSLADDRGLTPEDRTYLAQLVRQRTNLSQPEAEARVDQVYGEARQAAQQAREKADAAAKVAAWASLWMFIALLCGAFCASVAALYGGRRRDSVIYLVETDPYVTAPQHVTTLR